MLSIDLAEDCGWCILEFLPEPVMVKYVWPSGVVSQVKTRVVVRDSGTLNLHKDRKAATLQDEALWLDSVRRFVTAFLLTHPVDGICYEFSPWLRGSAKTSTRGIMATYGLRSALLMALADVKARRFWEVAPGDWQRPTIGTGKRKFQKSKSLAAAEQRLGFITERDHESDAALMGEWKLSQLAREAEVEKNGQE
jgi:hypothetical protein